MSIAANASMRMQLSDYRGLSAYEIAVNNGFEGTEEAWLASLRGADGQTTSVNSVQQVNGSIQLTGEQIPLSAADSRTLAQLAAQVDALLAAIAVTDTSVDLGGRYLDNALFR